MIVRSSGVVATPTYRLGLFYCFQNCSELDRDRPTQQNVLVINEDWLIWIANYMHADQSSVKIGQTDAMLICMKHIMICHLKLFADLVSK